MGLKWVKRDELVVSKEAVKDAVSNGVLKKVNQILLSKETGIRIEVYVGGKKNK